MSPEDFARIEALFRRVVREELARSGHDDLPPPPAREPREATHYNGALGADRHQELVHHLVEDVGCASGGFRHAVETAIGDRFADAPRITPDAYLIKPDVKAIGVFEVTVTSGMDRRKLDKICRWRAWILEHGWQFRLIEVYEHGKCLGIDPETGEWDDESRQHWLDMLHERPIGS